MPHAGILFLSPWFGEGVLRRWCIWCGGLPQLEFRRGQRMRRKERGRSRMMGPAKQKAAGFAFFFPDENFKKDRQQQNIDSGSCNQYGIYQFGNQYVKGACDRHRLRPCRVGRHQSSGGLRKRQPRRKCSCTVKKQVTENKK